MHNIRKLTLPDGYISPEDIYDNDTDHVSQSSNDDKEDTMSRIKELEMEIKRLKQALETKPTAPVTPAVSDEDDSQITYIE